MTNISHTDYTQRRDEILEAMIPDGTVTDKKGVENETMTQVFKHLRKKTITEAASQIDQLIDEYIIGENEYPAGGLRKQGRNQLRAELRNIIKGNQS